jgi:nucleotide-binding universal stress UspA family protein
MEYRSIVCPIDGSPLSMKGEETAAYLSKCSGGRLILLHVVEKWYKSSAVTTDSKAWNNLHNEWLNDGRELLKKEEEKLRADGVINIESVIREGDAAHEIIEVAKQRNADLIVMTAHHHSPVTKLFMGSLIDEVTRMSRCPVLWIFK